MGYITRRDPRSHILRYVEEVIDRDGVAPSYGMICRDVGFNTRQEVAKYVRQLEERGHLRRVGSGRVRRIRLSGNYTG